MKIEIPKNWNQVTLQQFIQLQNIEMNLSTDLSELDYELQSMDVIVDIISVFNGQDKSVITSHITIPQLHQISNELIWMNTKPELVKPDDKFKVIPIDKISYNKFIYMNTLKTEDMVNNMSEIVMGFTNTDLTKYEIEHLPITQVLYVIDDVKKKYTKYAKDLIIRLQTHQQVQEFKHRLVKRIKKLGKKFTKTTDGTS
jgi:hypothetical protein